MTGIWHTFELPELQMVANFFTCGSGGESAEIDVNSKTADRPKQRSLYLPSDDERSVIGQSNNNRRDVEEKLILNRYAPKSRSFLGKANTEQQHEDTGTSKSYQNDTETSDPCEDDVRIYFDFSRQFGHDRIPEDIHQSLSGISRLPPTYGNIIVVVQRDVKNNTIAINFESKPS
jgi:hypothetical protein